MKVDVKVPAVGESVSEATIGSWTKKSGEFVKRNEVVLLLETDKASVEVIADSDGVLNILAQSGEVVKIGATVGVIDSEGTATVASAAPVAASPAQTNMASAPAAQAVTGGTQHGLSPAVQKIVTEKGLNPNDIQGTGKDGRLTKGDVLTAQPGQASTPPPPPSAKTASAPAAAVMPTKKAVGERGKKIVPMTSIRKRIAERLVQAQHNAAMLTTFNEIDMSRLNEMRNKYKDKFKEKYGINLGMMGIFTKACVEALKASPIVNAYILDTNEVEYHDYINIGVAVSTEKGLMVPVIKDVDLMSVAEIEMAIRNFALKARDGKIGIDDLNGGTFTITNGGVFGSLLSTPILNPPQTAIMGMHKTEDRAVVINGQIVARPMMYVAMSYDHRLLDGKEAVGFLVKVKEGVEDPERLLLEI